MDTVPKRRVAITADSTCDLSQELVERYGVEIIPLYVSLGDNTYRDGLEIRPSDLFNYFDTTGELPKTSAPSITDYTEVFSRLTADGADVVHLNISSEFSSSHNNACIAAKEVGHVHVVDSRSLSTGIGLMVILAAEMATDGAGADEIVAALNGAVDRVEASFVVDTLTYIRKGGRCSSVAALSSNLLKIKPCIEVSGGEMHVARKYQGSLKRCLERYVAERLGDRADIDTSRVFITYTAQAPEIVGFVEELVGNTKAFGETLVTEAGSTIASHCGPGTLGVLFMRKS